MGGHPQAVNSMAQLSLSLLEPLRKSQAGGGTMEATHLARKE